MQVVVPKVAVRVKVFRAVMVRAERGDATQTVLLPVDVAAMRVVLPKAVDQEPVVKVAVPKVVVRKDARVLMDLRHITRNDSSNTRWSSTRTKTASSAKRSC